MKRKLVFATNNKHKLEEIRAIVGDKIELLSLSDIACFDEIDETGATLEENALIKVRHVKQKYGYDCFGDDTGLEVDALNGEPGVYSARYAGESCDSKANIAKLLSELKNKTNRNAHFRSVIALTLDGKEYIFEGKIEGQIIEEARGSEGFGYDPVFQPTGYSETFAEQGSEVKNEISHRALAVKALCAFINEV